jgi:hypothetical protein
MEPTLRNKITELFEYRDFPLLYKFSKIAPSSIEIFNENLIQLQASIYHLDFYLETNWQIKKNEKATYWRNIKNQLAKFDIAQKDVDQYLSHIYKYEERELNLRKNKLPISLSTENYYYYKSCDVKLIRRLIYENLSNIKNLFTLSDWRYFDLVTEINDDASDLEEDLSTINGNLILISYYELGRDATIDYFNTFLDYCDRESEKRFGNEKNSFKKQIHKRTRDQIKATKKIIKDSKVLKESRESKLYQELKKLRNEANH